MKDESGAAAKETISIGSGDRESGADRMGMEVHVILLELSALMVIGELMRRRRKTK